MNKEGGEVEKDSSSFIKSLLMNNNINSSGNLINNISPAPQDIEKSFSLEESYPTQPVTKQMLKIIKYSHKLAERRRRKDMKNIFDHLNNLLPKSSGKRSRSEVLEDARKYIKFLQEKHQELYQKRSQLRADIETLGKSL